VSILKFWLKILIDGLANLPLLFAVTRVADDPLWVGHTTVRKYKMLIVLKPVLGIPTS